MLNPVGGVPRHPLLTFDASQVLNEAYMFSFASPRRRCCRCQVRPNRRLESMRAEVDEAAQPAQAQCRLCIGGGSERNPTQIVRHFFDLVVVVRRTAPMKTPLRWRLRHRHANRPQLAAGVCLCEAGQKTS